MGALSTYALWFRVRVRALTRQNSLRDATDGIGRWCILTSWWFLLHTLAYSLSVPAYHFQDMKQNVKCAVFSHVPLLATPWSVACHGIFQPLHILHRQWILYHYVTWASLSGHEQSSEKACSSPQVISGKTEAQREERTCPRSHSESMSEQGQRSHS